MTDYILEVYNLKKYFPITTGVFNRVIGYVKAVDNVSFKMPRRGVFAIVGETGCGKSTLARTIIGIYEPTSGRIVFGGVDLTSLKPSERRKARRKMAMVFQDPTSSLNPRHKVIDIITAPLKVHRIGSREERLRRAKELIELVGLSEDMLYKYPYELSGGQRQRVAIARALVMDPELVILDEPTSSLDVSVQAKIIELLEQLRRKLKLKYLLITHDLSLARNFADYIAVMYAGKIVEIASTETIFTKPLHPYTRALLSAIFPLEEEEEKIISKFGIETKPGEPPSLVNPPPGCRFHPRCPFAKPICMEREPPMIEVEKEHWVACWLYTK